jgi:hypothetical protein
MNVEVFVEMAFLQCVDHPQLFWNREDAKSTKKIICFFRT